jgi:predicted alpha/beta hydrolase family esterase
MQTKKSTMSSSSKHHVVIVPRWAGTSTSDWYPNFESKFNQELKSKDYTLDILDMPNPGTPTIEAWTGHLLSTIKRIEQSSTTENHVFHFVGHSVGCNTVIRTLVANPQIQTSSVLLVAGWVSLNEPWDTSIPWQTYPDGFFNKVGQQIGKKITLLVSDNDNYTHGEVMDHTKQVFTNQVGATIVEISGAQHFNAPDAIEHVWKVFLDNNINNAETQ